MHYDRSLSLYAMEFKDPRDNQDDQSMKAQRLRNCRLAFVIYFWVSVLVAACIFSPAYLPAQSAGSSNRSMLTETRVKASGWWPTKGSYSRKDYVGTAECVKCHAEQATVMQKSAMARAASSAADAESLQHSLLSFQIGPYHYQINKRGGATVLGVSKGTSSLSAKLLWAFGAGRIGQTYVYEANNRFYESHLTFYSSIQALDITPGHQRTVPSGLEESAGRRVTPEETRRCFGCHTTASTTNDHFEPQIASLGISCEACHGPGADHVAAARSGMDEDLVRGFIGNTSRLSPLESVDFCGACHRTYKDVVSDGPIRIARLNIRFAPYRLEKSRCWMKADARITCVACHDPHKPLSFDPASYDSNCLQCHLAAGAKEADSSKTTACQVGVRLCVTCHMQKFRDSTLHTSFTDHWIRIATPGAPLPD
jgi:Cytochrome c554 and c-prime